MPNDDIIDYDRELLELAAQGKVKLPEVPFDEQELEELLNAELPKLHVQGEAAEEVMRRIWEEERGEY